MSAFGPKRTFRGGITRKTPIKRETSLVIWRRESSPLRQRIGSKQGQFAESCDCGLQMRRSARRGYPTRSDAPHQTAAEHRYGNGAQGSEWSRMEQIGHVYLVKRATQPRGMS